METCKLINASSTQDMKTHLDIPELHMIWPWPVAGSVEAGSAATKGVDLLVHPDRHAGRPPVAGGDKRTAGQHLRGRCEHRSCGAATARQRTRIGLSHSHWHRYVWPSTRPDGGFFYGNTSMIPVGSIGYLQRRGLIGLRYSRP